MRIYQYKHMKWTAKQAGEIIELKPFGVNGGKGPKFGKYVFAEMLANKDIALCKKELQ